MFSAASERPDWRFSIRLALGVGGLFAVAVVALYLGAGAMQERVLAHEEAALVLDRREDIRIAWQSSGEDGLVELLKELETTTGEQLAVRVEKPDGEVTFEDSTANAPDISWAQFAPAGKSQPERLATAKGWTATSMDLASGEILRVARFSSVIADVRNAYRGLFTTTVGPLLLAGISGSVILVIIALRPMRRTVAVMRHIVQTGDWSARVVSPRAKGEMRNLAEAFNDVLERQQKLIESMRQSLDCVAHDLRTPLTRLQVTVESGLDKTERKPARDILIDCLEETQRVRATLDTLMDVAEAESGAMKLRLEEIQVSELFAEIAELYEFAAEEKNARIETDLPGELVFIGDHVRLRRALANLVDNALKYLGSGHRVVLSTEVVGREIILRVEDDGMGITPEDLPRVWERLFRVDRSRSAPGMGLGLSLVRAIAEAHEGRAEVRSTPGKGSVFQLRLPYRSGAES